MNTYEELLRARQLTTITVPAAEYLFALIADRLTEYSLHLSNNPPKFESAIRFLESEVIVLQNIKKYLKSYLNEHKRTEL